MAPGPGMFFAFLEARITEALLRTPLFHRFVGSIHKRYRWMKQGKTSEEIMEENAGTNEKQQSEEGKQVLLRHFREELGAQWRGLGGRGGKDDRVGGNRLK